jgi:uncharacterized repeat protein (TIGR02543 family)
MSSMFGAATSFNQRLAPSYVSSQAVPFVGTPAASHGWDTSAVTYMSSMFSGAAAFDQDLGGWDTSKVASMEKMFDASGLSAANYTATLIAWAAKEQLAGVPLGVSDTRYARTADPAWRHLADTHNWVIADGGMDPAKVTLYVAPSAVSVPYGTAPASVAYTFTYYANAGLTAPMPALWPAVAGTAPTCAAAGYTATSGSALYEGAVGCSGGSDVTYDFDIAAKADLEVTKLSVWVVPSPVSVAYGTAPGSIAYPKAYYADAGHTTVATPGITGTAPTCTAPDYTATTTAAAYPGWIRCSGGADDNYAFVTSATATLTVTGAPSTYTLLYNGNGSTSGKAPVDAKSPYAAGATVSVLANQGTCPLAKSGSTFAGWNTAADGSGSAYAAGATFAIGSNTVLYAQWAPIRYTVTYSGNGATSGSAPVDAAAYAPGARATVLGNTGGLTRAGYVFSGWNTRADGKGTKYAPGAVFTIRANTVLYAVWTKAPVTYSVAYSRNGATSGAVPVDTAKYASGARATVRGNTGALARAGYTFAGWSTRADGAGTTYKPGAVITVKANVTLYAKWTRKC